MGACCSVDEQIPWDTIAEEKRRREAEAAAAAAADPYFVASSSPYPYPQSNGYHVTKNDHKNVLPRFDESDEELRWDSLGPIPTTTTTTTKTTTTTTSSESDGLAPRFQSIIEVGHKKYPKTTATKPAESSAIPTAAFNNTKRSSAHHLKNVFVAPLENFESFVAPNFPKLRVEKEFIRRALENNFVFQSMEDKDMDVLIDAFEKCEVSRGDVIIQQGDNGDYFYVLLSGACLFKVDGQVVGRAKPGQSFGELALLYTSPRAASVVANFDSVLFKVDQKTFRHIMRAQKEQTDTNKRELIKGVGFLSDLDEGDVHRLLGTMTLRVFKAGEYIIRKGEEGDAFYIIQEGRVRVTDIVVGQASYEDQTLGPGDYFGEAALFANEPRAANCIGKNKGILLRIDADVFIKVVGNLQRLVVKSQDKRKLAAIKPIQETHLDSASLAALANLISDHRFEQGKTIVKQGKKQKPALYLVRHGRVKITRQINIGEEEGETKVETEIVKSGGYFGENMLRADRGEGDACQMFMPKMTATTLTSVDLGVLLLEDCRQVFDTSRIGRGKKNQFTSFIDTNIRLQELEKKTILGAGTFGQVWLVSKKLTSGQRQPFALKIQSKHELIQSSQAKGVVQEKNIMAQLQNPFIIQLIQTYQDISYVYMLLGLVQGGELFSVLHHDDVDSIPESQAKFYAAGILEGLAYMHRRHILYRDLKPENVLIDNQGYPIIVDLGFAKRIIHRTYTLCGTPLYLAPEVILNRGHDAGADHWSLGVLIFEMIVGHTPFYKEGMDQVLLFRSIVKGKYQIPKDSHMSLDAEGLVAKLLVKEPAQRLGSLARGEADIFNHYWFQDIVFYQLRQKEIKAPWIPNIRDPLDASNFDNWDHLEDKTSGEEALLSADEQKVFHSF